jgi:hypothetical protein
MLFFTAHKVEANAHPHNLGHKGVNANHGGKQPVVLGTDDARDIEHPDR